MHAKSQLALKGHIKLFIGNITWDNDKKPKFHSVSDECLSKILGELKKQKGKNLDFLTDIHIFETMIKQLYSYYKNIPEDTPSNTLANILEPQSIEELVEKIIQSLIQLPRTYRISFKVPLFMKGTLFEKNNTSFYLQLESDINETTDFNIFANKCTSSIGGLQCTVEGYCSNIHDDTFKQAFSKLKVIIQQGLSKKIFLLHQPENIGYLSQIFKSNGKNIPLFHVDILDKSDNFSVERALPDHVNCFLNKLNINSGSLFNISKNEIEEFLHICNLITADDNADIKAIKSAIEWAFDSYSYEEYDISMAFLQVCFGLEALFTDETAPITKTLAIKCAYLISNSIDERHTIIDKIKEIYDLRSNLVHGRQNSLTLQQKGLFYLGRHFLELSIEKEITMYLRKEEV